MSPLYREAYSLESLGDLEAARSTWMQLWQQYPGDPEIVSAIERIAIRRHALSWGSASWESERDRLVQTLQQQEDLIERLVDIGKALSQSSDLREVLHLILRKSREITCCDAGSIYLVDRTGPFPVICFEVSQNDSQPERSLGAFALPFSGDTLVGYVALTGETLNLPDARNLPADAPYRHHDTFDLDINYSTRSVLVLPLKNSEEQVMGVLQLLNRKYSPEEIVTPENSDRVTLPFCEWQERILQSLASQVTVFIERNQLARQASSI